MARFFYAVEPDLPVEPMAPMGVRSHGCVTNSDCKAGEYCKNAFPVGTSCWAGPVCFCVPKPSKLLMLCFWAYRIHRNCFGRKK